MAAFSVGHSYWDSFADWRDVHLGSGGEDDSASAACQFSQTSESGAFAYQRGADYGELCRHRFIVWSCLGSSLQLVELSMHNDLVGGAVRLHLPSQCLPGVQVHELGEHHVLVACASAESVHCLLLPHPVALWQGGARGGGAPSVLQALTQDTLSRVMMSQPVYGQRVLCTSVANSNQVLFALPAKSDSILLVQVPLRAEGVGFQFEHHLSGVMQRLWSGLTRAGDAPQGEGLVLHATQHRVTMAMVTSDLKLQCWGIENHQAQLELSLPLAPTDLSLAELQRIRVAKGEDPVISDNFAVIVYFELSHTNYVCVCQLARDNLGQLTAAVMATIPVQKVAVADMALSGSDLWLLGEVDGSSEVLCVDLHSMKQVGTPLWAADRRTEVVVPSGTTVQEAYTTALFSHSGLSAAEIVEGLRRMGNGPIGGAGRDGMREWLRQQTILAVEKDVQLAASYGELSVENFAALEHRCWGALYQHCLRASVQGRGRASLFLDSAAETVAVISAGCVSALLPGTTLRSPLPSNQEVVLGWVTYIKELVPEALLQEVLVECSVQSPMMEEFVQSLLEREGGAMLQALDHIADLASCLRGVADTLVGRAPSEDTKGDLAVGQIGSRFSAGLMSSLLYAMSREGVGMGVALLAMVGVLSHAEPDSVDAELSSGLCGLALCEGPLICRVSNLVTLNCCLAWLASTPPVPCTTSLLERTPQLAKALGLPTTPNRSPQGRASLAEVLFTWLPTAAKGTVADMFRAFWDQVWPEGGPETVAVGLLLHAQFSHTEHYCDLVMQCLTKGIHSLKVLKGLAQLSQGDFPGAVQHFISAAGGIGDQQEPLFPPTLTLEMYYSRVVQALNTLGVTQSAVMVLKDAVRRSDPSLPVTSMLWSLLFKHQTQLSHFNSAYSTMLAIPDRRRQLDCLRYLLTLLLDKQQGRVLCGLSFRQLEPDAGQLLEMRARGADLLAQNTYPTLYSFYILRKNYRKGAAAMFEWACRIGQELQGLPALRQQASCLAAALSCLRLVEEGGAWVVRLGRPGTVVDLAGLSREYALARARLGLAKHSPTLAEPVRNLPHDAAETLPALVKARQYQSALGVAKACALPCSAVLEGVASHCVRSRAAPQDSDVSGSRGLATRSTTGKPWSVLGPLLRRCPDEEQSECLRIVAHKLLSNGVALPQWLVEFFQETDAVSLLKVLLSFDQLQEATEVALDSMESSKHNLGAVLRTGSLQHCLPRFCLEHLLHRLQSSHQPDWQQNYDRLQLKYERTFL